VTLASCEGAKGGSVVGAGASIAHALHEGGVPLVVAAQFPLSFPASVLMAEVLYNGLLWGTDPRILLNDLRWRLKSIVRETHDWASLVAYASLPADIESQLSQVRFQQSRRCINTALKYMDRVTAKMRTRKTTPNEPTLRKTPEYETDQESAKERARRKIADAKERVRDLLREASRMVPSERAQIYGLLASTEKRDAELLYRASVEVDQNILATGTGAGTGPCGSGMGPAYASTSPTSPHATYRNAPGLIRTGASSGTSTSGLPGGGEALELMREALQRAHDHYAAAFRVDRESSWALTQELCVAAVLGSMPVPAPPSLVPALSIPPAAAQPPIPRDPWTVARELADADLDLADPMRVTWAHGSLIELYMLCQLMPAEPGLPDKKTAHDRALEHATRMVKMGGRDSFEVYSTRRQIERYTNWFNEISPAFERLETTARDVLAIIPFNPRFA
jgi:hypothetical protein